MKEMKNLDNNFWLTNVKLETGFYKDSLSTRTKTNLFNILITDGKFKNIIPAATKIADGLPQKDARGLLMLPAFVEAHCHLDKTLIGDAWRPAIATTDMDKRLDYEYKVRMSTKTSIQDRAEKLLNSYVKAGVTHVRTHVDVYPEIGLDDLKKVKQALHKFDDKLTYEIVAMPQHGLLKSHSESVVKRAMENGADLVGGIDPAGMDDDPEKSLRKTFEIAAKYDAGIDLHLHDSSELGIYTLKKMAQMTVGFGLQNKVTVSHAYCLGEVPVAEAQAVSELLADAGIRIVTSAPINQAFPPIEVLEKEGVSVALGSDNIYDTWSPFGNGDILERASRLAESSDWVNEKSLAHTLSFITNGKTPLDENGKKVWPNVGDEASVVLVDATCSAETIARRSKRVLTMYQGKITYESLD